MLTDNEQPSLNAAISSSEQLVHSTSSHSRLRRELCSASRRSRNCCQHNTIVQPVGCSDIPTTGFVFKDNIVANYQYGMQRTIPSGGMAAAAALAMTGT